MSDENNPFAGLDMNGFLGQMMSQAKTMQKQVEKAQEKAADIDVEGSAGGGLVTVTASASGKVRRIRIDPVAVDKRDVEMLEDLLVAAVNDALRRGKEAMKQEVGQATGVDLGQIGDLLGNLGK